MIAKETKIFHEVVTTVVATLENEQSVDAALVGVKHGGHYEDGTASLTLEFEGVLFAKDLVALGNAFGDENPLVETKDNKIIVIIYNSTIS